MFWLLDGVLGRLGAFGVTGVVDRVAIELDVADFLVDDEGRVTRRLEREFIAAGVFFHK